MPKNGDKGYNYLRSRLLLFSGLAGIFVYMLLVEFFNRPFHFEFILGFLAMMGVSIAQGLDRE